MHVHIYKLLYKLYTLPSFEYSVDHEQLAYDIAHPMWLLLRRRFKLSVVMAYVSDAAASDSSYMFLALNLSDVVFILLINVKMLQSQILNFTNMSYSENKILTKYFEFAVAFQSENLYQLVACQTPNKAVAGSNLTSSVLCP